ncbi:hypothetical protein DNTS_002634 [Danionella cerebrum]|uniref:receptor protein-tyrosine kinase n=1 Tax=Danionella cerebrum TaxID=2873325 RepID=A0A553QZI3_9TELE|nr:hypothetical protein DNTS_002634 [Danionella translucida]
MNESIEFHCEAKNARGISVSRTGMVHIKVRPGSPQDVKIHHVSDFNTTLSWAPGFSGHSQTSSCTLQVEYFIFSCQLSKGAGRKIRLPDVLVEVPPFQHVLEGLSSFSNYSVRICCENEVGSSPFSPWVDFHTPEAAPSAAPQNLTFDLSEQQLTLAWASLEQEELRGRLQGYKVQWNQAGESQDPLLFKDNVAHLSGAGRFFNTTFQVAACTMAGCGPWSRSVLVMPVTAKQAQIQRGHMWVGLLFGLLLATMVGLLLIVVVRNRSKETQFGSAFAAPGAEVPVSFTAARSFNRQFPELPESTLDSLGIDSDLKAKLQDVLISEKLLTLGRMLGKGEFGSVREAFLKSENNSGQKVAVKVLKCVSLHRRAQQRLPVPMVILPFMKHGDLHTFLLLSRLGDQPFHSSTLHAFGGFSAMFSSPLPSPAFSNLEIIEQVLRRKIAYDSILYEIMHSCWSPVPKCRPSFKRLIDQLELLRDKLNPAPVKEPQLYVNLKQDEEDKCAGVKPKPPSRSTEEPLWGVPWQCVGLEEDEKDWLMVSSGAALAIGGDYRYIIGPSESRIDEESRQSESGLSEDIRDDEEDVVINV